MSCYGHQSEDTKNKQWFQVLLIMIVSVNSLSAGLFFAWTSSAIPDLISDNFPIEISIEDASYLSVVPPLATILFSPLMAHLVERYGRKPMVVFMNLPYLIAWLITAFSNSIYLFYFARFIGGISDAIYFAALPSYIGEVCEPKVRGTWGNILTFQLYAALICACVPVVGFIAMLFIPETPYYLIMKNKEDQAIKSLKQLRRVSDVTEEFTKLTNDVKRQISESGSLKDLFYISTNRKALFFSIGLRVAQQFSGFSAFAVYTQYIFQLAEGSISKSTSAMIFTGTVAICIVVSTLFLDKFGRRKAMMISCIGSGTALTAESVYFYCSNYGGIDTSRFGWMPITGMLVYVIFYCIGLALIPTLMLSELFSASIKGKALGISNIVFAICVLGTTKLFQILTTNFGLFAPFSLFAGCCYAFTLFSYFIPETRGKTLEEIQQSLKGTKKDIELTEYVS